MESGAQVSQDCFTLRCIPRTPLPPPSPASVTLCYGHASLGHDPSAVLEATDAMWPLLQLRNRAAQKSVHNDHFQSSLHCLVPWLLYKSEHPEKFEGNNNNCCIAWAQSYDHCTAEDHQGLLKLGQSQTRLSPSWCMWPGHCEDHWAAALATHCNHCSDAVQCLCLYRACTFKGKLLRTTSSLHHFLYSYPQLNQLNFKHLPSRGEGGSRAVDLHLGNYFGHMKQIFLTHVGFLFPREKSQNLSLSTYVIAQKWLKINKGEKYYVSRLWWSQLLGRNTTKSCPVSCICGLSLQVSVTFALCTSKAILFFKDQR